MLVCERCGEENPDQARFCMACTAPLGAVASDSGRRTVTIVFSDLVGSTALGESLDPEALREVLDRYFDAMKACLERYGGLVEKYIGDAIMAVFGLPRAHEDDALRATLAASAMRERLVTLNEELDSTWGVRLTNRTGVHTGEVVTGDPASGLRLVTGDAVNTAARLEQAAPPGEILLGGPTHDLVAHAVTVEEIEPIAAKGKADAVPAFLLRSVRPLQAIARRPTAEMVGREEELAALLELYRSAVEERRCRVGTIVGEPGVGKSRLVAELAERAAGEARILSGRCLPYGEGMTYWPIAEAIREAAGIGEDQDRDDAIGHVRDLVPGADGSAIVDRLATAMGISSEPFSPEELSWAVRRLIEELTRERPLVLVIDDVQWADGGLIGTIDHVASFGRDARTLILLAARTELLEADRLPLGDAWAPPIVLGPLAGKDVDALLVGLLQGHAVEPAIVERVKAAAQGNPLFIEQLAASWADLGGSRSGPSSADERLPVPATLGSLLRARIDALPAASRGALERGAVMGQVLYRNAVADLGGGSDRDGLGEELAVLRSKRFVRPDVSPFADDEAWAFVHLLMRDTAYAGILKRARSGLHERFADWLEHRTGDRVGEFGDIVAHHLEQASLLRRELGPLDPAATTLVDRAISALERSAMRATTRFDHRSSTMLLQRAAALIEPDDGRRSSLLVRAMDAAFQGGDLDEVQRLRLRINGSILDEVTTARLMSVEASSGATRGELSLSAALGQLERAEMVLSSVGDIEGTYLNLRRQAHVLGFLGRIDDARSRSLEGSTLARELGRTDLEVDALKHVAMCAIFDSSEVSTTIELCRATLQEHADDRRFPWALKGPLAILTGMRGRFHEARTVIDELTALQVELGMTPYHEALLAEARAFVAISEGDPVTVEHVLRSGYETMLRTGETGFASSYASILGHAAAVRGLVAEALELAGRAEAMAGEDDYDAQVGWRRARALADGLRGSARSAETLIQEALSIVAGTDDINLQAETLLDQGHVFLLAGRREEADVAIDRAIDLFSRKGHIAGVDRAARLKREGWLTPGS